MNTQELARRVRVHVLEMAHRAHSSHVGSSLSCVDILAVLYWDVMHYEANNPKWEGRDRFIMSKGHASAALYATLAECGFFPIERLEEHCQTGSELIGHVNHRLPGIEASTGSLGHGLSIGCGMALATVERVFVLLGDGDLNEGSTWEAAMFACHNNLDNLTAIVDYNQMQALGSSESVVDLGSLKDKWHSFGWSTWEVDGHSCYQLMKSIRSCPAGQPKCVIAHTTKGKGVSFMEGDVAWHYKSPSDEELKLALEELS